MTYRIAYYRFIWTCMQVVCLAFCLHHTALGADQTATVVKPAFTPQALNDGWAISTPEAEGLDATALAATYAKAQQMTYIHSLLVLRHGKLVAERYFNGYTIYAADSVKSVSKSILSAPCWDCPTPRPSQKCRAKPRHPAAGCGLRDPIRG